VEPLERFVQEGTRRSPRDCFICAYIFLPWTILLGDFYLYGIEFRLHSTPFLEPVVPTNWYLTLATKDIKINYYLKPW